MGLLQLRQLLLNACAGHVIAQQLINTQLFNTMVKTIKPDVCADLCLVIKQLAQFAGTVVQGVDQFQQTLCGAGVVEVQSFTAKANRLFVAL